MWEKKTKTRNPGTRKEKEDNTEQRLNTYSPKYFIVYKEHLI